MKSTQAMRDRCRELSTPSDDYDRAVICILDDFEALEAAREIDLREIAAQLDQNTATMDVARARIEVLEAALREIAGWPSSCEEARNIARVALDKDTGK